MFRWGGVTYQRRLITSYCMWRFLVWELPNCSNKVPASRELGFLESQRINPDSMIFFPCMLSNSILWMINQNCFPLRERSGFVFAIQIECSAKSTDSWKDKFSVRISFSRSQWDLYCNCFLTFCMWVRRVTCLGRTSKGNQQTSKLFSVPHSAHHVHLMCLPILTQCIPLPATGIRTFDPAEMATAGGSERLITSSGWPCMWKVSSAVLLFLWSAIIVYNFTCTFLL